MSASAWEQLNPIERALVAVAVLIDGADAGSILLLDSKRGELLREAALYFGGLDLDARLPYMGTLLRRAVEDQEG